MPIELGSFDIIVGMDWLSKYHAVIVCDEKLVHIPFGDKTLTIHGDRDKTRLSIISCIKTQKYLHKGLHVFLTHINEKKFGEMSDKKRPEDVPIIQDFLEVFPEDFSRLPPATINLESEMKIFQRWCLGLTMVITNDILIYSRDKEEHEEHLKLILELLKKDELYAKFSKCKFWIMKVQFLSYVIESQAEFSYNNSYHTNIKAAPLKNCTKESVDHLSTGQGKLNPRYIGPFKIIAKVGPVAYRLELPKELSNVHNTFHISNFKKCLSDESLVIPLDEIQVDDKLHFIEESVEIMDRKIKQLKRSRMIIKIDSGLVVPVFKQGDEPIDAINKMMSFMSTVVTSRFPTTNNQLRNSSNLRKQATIHNGRVTIQPVKGRQNSFVAGTFATRTNISGTRGNHSGQQRIVKCFNCQGEGHMARQYPKPKRKRDATWFRDKVLLVEAQGSGKVLNEEESKFLVDPGVAEGPVTHMVITHNVAYHANDLDAYDSDCNDFSIAKAVLMVNSSSYGSDVLSEVPHSKNTHSDILNQSVQEMTYFEQTHLVNYPENEITSDSNIIPYSQYLLETQNAAIQDTNSSVQQDAMILSVFKQLSNQATNCNKIRPMLYDGSVIAKETNVISIANSEETLMLEEESLSKMLLKQSDPMLQTSHLNTDQSASLPVKNEAPRELPKKFKLKDIVDNAAQMSNATTITPGMYKLDPVTMAPKDKNNRETHIYYLKYTMEQAAILKEIVKQAAILKHALPVRVSQATKSSRSKSTANTKNDRIMQIPSSTQKKNKVEDHSRNVKSCLNKSNYVVKPSGYAHVQHSKLNTNSELMRIKCNSSMFDARHELFFLEFVLDMNASSKSKSVKRAKNKEEWKPTGKVFTKIGYNWKPTGRTFTLVGNACPLTRITTTNKVPLREPIPLEVVAQESVVTKVYTRRPKVPKTNGSNSKPKIAKFVISNKIEPDSGCSKHMTRDRSQLTNFVHKFLGTIKFGNDQIEKIIGNIRTYNGTEFVNQTLRSYYESVGISHETSVARSPQQNGVVKRPNLPVVAAPRAVDFADSPMSTSIDQDAPLISAVNSTLFTRKAGNDLLMAKPTEKHLNAVKQIFQYLKGTINMGLWYSKDTGMSLTAYADADHARCSDTRRSTSGSAQFLRDKLVSWSSKKQKSAAISSTEAEYIALSRCCT
nr:reverse transcriptase domain-containing protein [Tanacetum cinerariifolium]